MSIAARTAHALARPQLAVLLASLRARLVLIYVLALVPAMAMAAIQPVWSRVDEPQHADVLAQYAHGVVPVMGVTKLQPEIVAIDEATGVYRWYPAGSGPVPTEKNPQAFVPPPPSASAAAQQAWMGRHLWGFSYEAMQPPLYYLIALPAWILGGQSGDTMGAIYAARLFSALIAACLAPLVYLLALAVRPGTQRMPIFAAGFAALLPGYVLNATQITNDGLAAVLGAALTIVAVTGVRDGWTRPLAVGCGALLGAAAMAKLTAVGLAPLVAAAFLWPGAQSLRARVAYGAIAAAVAAVIVAPWLVFNLHAYGQLVPSHAARSLLGTAFGPPPRNLRYLVGSAHYAIDGFVAGEPLGTMPFTRPLHWFELACALFAAAGLWVSRKRLRVELLLLVGVAGDFLWVMGTPYLSGVGGPMPGRYLYPAAAAALVLVAVGFQALPLLLARVVAVAGAAGALLVMAVFAFGQLAPSHYQPLTPPSVTTAVHAHGDAAGLDVVADRVAIEDGGRAVWIHVTVTDVGSRPADFQPIPDARTSRGAHLNADYPNSTPLPERLEPGQSASGWLRFTRSSTSHLTQFRVYFRNVTSDGYATIETLSLVVAP